jgi:acyl dehydratase
MQERAENMIETIEKIFSEKDLLMGILWEGDSQLHTNAPGMAKTPFGSTIVHGNSVTSMIIGELLRTHFMGEEKITVLALNVSYVGAVHMGESIRGIFEITGKRQGKRGEIHDMNFEVLKNGESRVSKGTISIEIE